jgi:hypothetical protein
LRCPSLPACPPRTRVKVALFDIDLLQAEAQCRYLTTLGEAQGVPGIEEETFRG